MSDTAHIIRGSILLIASVAAGGWLLVHSLKRSQDPPRLIVKWILTGLILWFLIRIVVPMADPNTRGAAAWDGIVLALVCGLALTAVWRHSMASIIAKPLGSLFDGGDREVDPCPVYSVAQAKRNRGYYLEAVREIRKQLEQFPQDFQGQLLLAEIQTQNLNDLPGAEVTIQHLCNQPRHAPRNIAFALNSLADWHLKYAQDREAARQDLEKIIALLPESEMAALAAQRIAHLADTAFLLAPHDRQPVALATGVADVGLLPTRDRPAVPEADPGRQAAEYVRHLENHPLDTEARENLARLYADHYQRLDLAADQLEQLIAHPAQPASRIVRWLNLLADLQIQHSADYETVRRTVQRIIDRYPGMPPAETARRRLDHLRLELKAKEMSQTVKLGSYEQDIGLKSKR
jgi:outer membrane protein assembly factor BamD (BamD/ComL family)